MRVIEAPVSGPIGWSIYKDDPPSVPLQSIEGWSLLSPLLYPELLSGMSVTLSWTIAWYDDAALLNSAP